MKLTILAAAAILATPVLAQSGTQTSSDPNARPASTPGMPTTNGTMSDQQPGAATSGSSGSGMSNGSMSNGSMSNGSMSSGSMNGDPVGGYQPSRPAMSGTMQPGATVQYQQAPTPDQAYPAPAPLAHYPMCKPGQFDKCMQGPHSTHSRQVRGRHSM